MRLWTLVFLSACSVEPVSELDEYIGGSGSGVMPPPQIDVTAIAKTITEAGPGYPAQFQLWSNSIVQRADFFARATASFQLAGTDAMVATPTVAMPTNLTVTTYQQTSSGVPVEAARYDLIERDGNLIAGAGQLAPGLALSPTPSITAAASATVAMPPGPTYHWQFIQDATQPAGELTFYSPDFGATQPFRLVWRFAFATTTAAYVAHVDATTGALVDKVRTDRHVATSGVKYDGVSVTLNTDLLSPGQYRLLDLDNGHKIQTYDAGANAANGLVNFLDADNKWTELVNRRGVSPHWAAEQAWNYLASFGYKGIDGSGAATLRLASLNVMAVCGQTLPYFGDQLSVLCNQDLDLESAAHEIGHQVLTNRAALGITPETDAIAEGLPDIFATSVQRFASGSDADWLLFDKSGGPAAQWRDMANPKTHAQPDTYGGAAWATEMAKPAPDGHMLDGVINKWFYLLAHGGSGTNDVGVSYAISGLGRIPAEEIVLAAIAHAAGLGSTPTLVDLRRVTIANALLLFGDDFEVAEVAAAWDAVNVIDGVPASQIWRLPADGDEGVRAWPTQFQFQTPFCTGTRCATEIAWLVEYSTDSSFANATQVMVTSQSFLNGKITSTAVANLHPATVYYWRAKAQYSTGVWSSVWRFTSRFLTGRQQPRNCAPTAVSAPVKPWPATFSWDAVDGAVGYEIQIASDSQFTQSVVPITNVGATTTWPSKVPVASSLYWRVRAVGPANARGDFATKYDGAGTGSTKTQQETKWSYTIALGLHTSDPVPANLTVDGSTVHPFTTTLAVTPNGASAYQLKWAAQPLDCTTNAGTIVPAPSGSATLSVVPSSTVYWCGRGVGYFNDHTSWSKTYTLHIDNGAPTGPPLAPGPAPWPLVLHWGAVVGCDHYEVQAGPAASPYYDAIVGCVGPDPVYAADVPALGGDPQWRVRAFNANNVATAWGSYSYNIDPELTKPVPTSPSGNLAQQQVTFTWQPVSGADHYEVSVWNAQNNLVATLPAGTPSATTTLEWGAYSWSVVAFSWGAGYQGVTSDKLAFSLQQPAPCGATFDIPIYGNGAQTDTNQGNYFDHYVTLPSYPGKTISATITQSTDTPSNIAGWGAAFFVDLSGGPQTNEMLWTNVGYADPATKQLTTGDITLPSGTLDLYFEPDLSCYYGGSPCDIDIHVVVTCK